MKILTSWASRFEPRGPALGFGRALLAGAQLTVLLFNGNETLFTYLPELPDGIRCDGARGLSLWCVGGAGAPTLPAAKWIAVATLVLVITGYRPRWTCIPHWYVAYSMSVSITLPVGGDLVAQIVTLLLIPCCLGDGRTWQWSQPQRALAPRWRGAAAASHLAIRVQASIIYLTAGISKLLVPVWRDGTAMFNLVYDPNYGMPQAVVRTVEPAFRWYAFVAAFTWAVVAIEVLIGVLVLGSRRSRLLALSAGIGLHSGIILLMGLPSFGLAMIALLLLCCAGTSMNKAQYPSRELENSKGAIQRDYEHSTLSSRESYR